MTDELRRAVSAAVRRADGLVLAVQRPDEPGEELPRVWGLPAVTLHDGESPEDGVRRIGREKLDVELTPVRALADGEQQREAYTLQMTVYEASIVGGTGAARTISDIRHALRCDRLAAGGVVPRRGAARLALLPFVSGGPHPWPLSDKRRGELGIGAVGCFSEDARRDVRGCTAVAKGADYGRGVTLGVLRSRQLRGRKFRRQQPIGLFVVDFYCAAEKLVVEVDGPVHDAQQDSDRDRREFLEATGLRVIRISAEDVESDLDGVLATISATFASPD